MLVDAYFTVTFLPTREDYLFHLRQLTSTLMHEPVCYTQTAICHYIKQVSL